MKASELLNNAIIFLQSGYFEGAQLLARELIRQGKKLQKEQATRISWLATIYKGDEEEIRKSKSDFESAFAWIKVQSGRQCLAEAAVHQAVLKQPYICVDEVLETAQLQSGVLVTHHPSAILMLADICQYQLDRREDSIRLVNLALGFRGLYVKLADVRRLAFLLHGLEAPISLWADLATIFARHIVFAWTRRDIFRREFAWNQAAVKWAIHEDNNSLKVLKDIVQIAPSHFRDLFVESCELYASGCDMERTLQNQDIVECGLKKWEPTQPIWWSLECMTYRYFWMNMLEESEQRFIQNGDWALFLGPNQDFSMGTAQWCRCVESVLKRLLIQPLAELFSQNQDWAVSDNKLLTAKGKNDESCFFEIADPEKSKKMTLGAIIKVLGKCIAGEGSHGSKLREEASRYVRKYISFFGPLMKPTLFNPAMLTPEFIETFRNRTAHDQSMTMQEASLGRARARILLHGFFLPNLEARGIPQFD